MNEEAEQESSSEPGADVPKEIVIAIQGFLGGRTVLHCGPGGIALVRGKTARTYSWDDVERVLMFRNAVDEPGFRQLQVRLPAMNPIVLRIGGRWSGPEPEVIAAFLEQHLEPPTLDIAIQRKTWKPKSPEEVDVLRGVLERSHMSPLKPGLLLTVFLFFISGAHSGRLRDIIPFVIAAVLMWAILLRYIRKGRKYVRSLNDLRAELAERRESEESGEEALNEEEKGAGTR